jgi:hypothetical protein
MRGERPTPLTREEPLRPGRLAVVALATIAAAIGLGVAARYASGAGLIAHAGPIAEPAGKLGPWVVALGAPWLAVAWALGAVARRVDAGAVAGALALAGGTGAWYAFTVWQVGRGALGYALPVSMAWAMAAIVAGAVFGIAGALWRTGSTDGGRALGAAVLAACFIGEAVLLATIWNGRAARVVLSAELLFGLALPFLLLGGRHQRRALALALLLTAVLAVFAAGAESVVRDALRHVGWGGR